MGNLHTSRLAEKCSKKEVRKDLQAKSQREMKASTLRLMQLGTAWSTAWSRAKAELHLPLGWQRASGSKDVEAEEQCVPKAIGHRLPYCGYRLISWRIAAATCTCVYVCL